MTPLTHELRKLVNYTRSTWLESHCETEDEASGYAASACSMLESMAVELAEEVLRLRKAVQDAESARDHAISFQAANVARCERLEDQIQHLEAIVGTENC